MSRVRQQTAAPAQPTRRRRAVNVEAMRTAADDFLSRFGGLVDEIVSLREALAEAQEENAQLRAELAEGIDLFRDARALVDQAEPARRRRGRGTAPSTPAPARAAGVRGRGRAAAARNGAGGRAARAAGNGRATPASVTADVVRAVIGKLGTATAGEIAAQISQAGTPVSGRAIRHIDKGAGAVMRPGDDGRMVYSLS
ncbi:MAG: hypothetical protein QOG45_626 [Chloroflexota bacterium]|nr:hypothetical protein [Chloroflexota bacterium]